MKTVVVKPKDIMLLTDSEDGPKGPQSGPPQVRTGVEIAPPQKKDKKEKPEPSDDGQSGGQSDDQEKGDKDDNKEKDTDGKGKGSKGDEEPPDNDDKDGEKGGGGDSEEPEGDDKDAEGEPDDQSGGAGQGDQEQDKEQDSDDQEGGSSDGDSGEKSDGGDSDSDSSSSDQGDDGEEAEVGDTASSKKKLDKLKDELSKKGTQVEDGSALDDLLKNQRDADKDMLGSHNEEGNIIDKENDPTSELGASSPDINGDLDIHLDDELNNLIDSEEEIDAAVETNKENKKAQKGQSASLSDIHMIDKTTIVYKEVMTHVNRWIKKLKGEQEIHTDWRTDSPSRKIKGLWGREVDSEPPEETTNKGLLFIFDTSGSMASVAKLMGNLCSDLAIKMSKEGIVNKIAMINLDGIWSSPKKFEPVMGLKQKMRRFLRVETGSSAHHVWNAIITMIKTDRVKLDQLSGIVIVSDFQLDPQSMVIPPEVRKLKPSVLCLSLHSGYGDSGREVMRFVSVNKSVPIFAISIDKNKKVKVLNTLRVAGGN